MHAKLPRRIRSRRHHATLVSLPAHNYRLPFQRWIVKFFDRHEERVHVYVEREAGSCGRAGSRAWRGVGGFVCGAEVWRAFGNAATDGGEAVSAGDFRGWPSRAVSRVFKQSVRSPELLFAKAGDGFH